MSVIPEMKTKRMSDNLTLVSIRWRKNRRNYRLLFGAPVRHVRLDWQRSLTAFAPGSIFGYERWEGNKFGTQSWLICVVEAAAPQSSVSQIPGIIPGARALISLRGKAACTEFLTHLDTIAASAAPEELDPQLWLHIGHRLSAGKPASGTITRILERHS